MTFKKFGSRRVQDQDGDKRQHPGQEGVEGDNWSYLGSPGKERAFYEMPAETGRRGNHSLPLTSSQRLPGRDAGHSGASQAKCNQGGYLGTKQGSK